MFNVLHFLNYKKYFCISSNNILSKIYSLFPSYFFDYNTSVNTSDETLLYNVYLLELDYYTTGRKFVNYTQNPINLQWGQTTIIDYTNNTPLIGGIGTAFTQLPHPSGTPVYVRITR
jgi:hypothetical protein